MILRRRRHRRPTRCELSIYDPIPFGIDENGQPVAVTLMYRNLLAGGEPGSGKSSLLNTIIAHAALCSGREAVAVRRQARRTRAVAPGRRRLRRQRPSTTPSTGSARAAGRDGRPLPAARRRRPPQDRPHRRAAPSSSASSTNSPTSRSPSAPRTSRTSSRPWSATSSPAAGPPASSCRRHPTTLARTSSPPACGTCSGTGSRSAAPPTPAATSSCPSAGPRRATPPAPSAPRTSASAGILAEGGIPRRFKAAYLTDAQIRAVIATALRRPPRRQPRRLTPAHQALRIPASRTNPHNHSRNSAAIPVTGGVCPCPPCSRPVAIVVLVLDPHWSCIRLDARPSGSRPTRSAPASCPTPPPDHRHHRHHRHRHRHGQEARS